MAIYYVDQTGGDNGNTGLAPDAAWKTISKVNSSSFSPGDSILFKRGETWREQLTVPSSGSAGNPVTFGAYGSGEAPKITGANILGTSGWTLYDTNTYQKALTTDPGNYVLEDGSMMTKVASAAAAVSTEKSFYWASNVIYIHATGGVSPETNGKVYETPIRSWVSSVGGNDYVTFDGLILEMGQGTSFLVQADGAQSFTLKNSTLRYSNFIGLWVSDSPKTNTMVLDNNSWSYMPAGFYMHGDDITVKNNSLSHINRGIELRDVDNAHCQNFLIEHNTLTDLGSSIETNAGLIFDSDTYSDNSDYHQGVVRYNYFDRLQGRAVDGFLGNSEIYYNIIKNITEGAVGSAIGLELNGKNNTAYNNVFYECGNYGLFLNNDPVAGDVANVVKNNIFYSTLINHIIAVSAGVVAATPPIINNNIYWMGSGGETKYQWGATDYTFTNWKTQSGGDANSIEVNPLFESPSTSDFRLRSGSPAINTGVDVGLTEDYEGNTVPFGASVDIGAYEYGLEGETGTGVDVLTVLETMEKSLSDSGAGADLIAALSSILVLADTGAGVDGLTIESEDYLTKSISDSGAGADALALAVTQPLSDAGVGSDALTIQETVFKALADAGSGVDALTTLQTVVKAIADSGFGLDALILAASLPLADSGSGADLVSIQSLLALADTGAGVDAMSKEEFVDYIFKTLLETGSGTDELAGIQGSIALLDAGTGADAVAVMAATILEDAGSAFDSMSAEEFILIIQKALADGGSAVDAIAELRAAIDLQESVFGQDILAKYLSQPGFTKICFIFQKRRDHFRIQ